MAVGLRQRATRRVTRRGARSGALLALLVLSAACTSVHRTATVGTGTGPGGTGRATSSGTTQSAGGAAGSGVTGGATGSAATGAIGGTSATGGVGGTGGTGGDLLGGAAPDGGAVPAGTTCTQTVKIGASYSSDEASGLAAVGNPAAATSAGDYVATTQRLFKVLADDINAQGGVAGCPVQVVFHDFSSLAADGFSGQSQKECADFAEDQHVFAVIAGGLENRTLVSCLAQHGVPTFFHSPEYTPVTADYAQYRGFLYLLQGVNPDRFGPYIDLYQQAGFFSDLKPGAKVGILEADEGTGSNKRLVEQIWKPRLEALGIEPVVFTFHMITSYSDVAATTSQLSSAVLQFKSQNVTHVMTTPDGGDVTIFFTQVAEQQGYRPRYALHSLSGVQAWFTEPAGQRPNAVAVSYTLYDLGLNPDPGVMGDNAPNEVRSHCDSIMEGQRGNTPMNAIYAACDMFNFLHVALQGAAAPTADALVAGADALGASLPLAGGYANASFASPAKYDGGSAVRAMVWDEAGQTFRYVTPPVAIP